MDEAKLDNLLEKIRKWIKALDPNDPADIAAQSAYLRIIVEIESTAVRGHDEEG